MKDGLRLDGKVALVTGGGRGIGRGIARRLGDAGARVVVCGRSAPAEPPPGDFVAADVRDPAACVALVEAVVAMHGRLDILVNNAGGSPEAVSATASPRFSERVIALNLLAPLNLSQAAYAPMTAAASGAGASAIINIASVSALRPSPGTVAYAAAKAGVLAMTRSLAHEWAPRIRVNAIVVGYIETEATEATYGDAAAQAAIAANIGAGRLGTPAEVAEAALFLASPAASYITGAALAVDGGGERPPFLNIVKEQNHEQ